MKLNLFNVGNVTNNGGLMPSTEPPALWILLAILGLVCVCTTLSRLVRPAALKAEEAEEDCLRDWKSELLLDETSMIHGIRLTLKSGDGLGDDQWLYSPDSENQENLTSQTKRTVMRTTQGQFICYTTEQVYGLVLLLENVKRHFNAAKCIHDVERFGLELPVHRHGRRACWNLADHVLNNKSWANHSHEILLLSLASAPNQIAVTQDTWSAGGLKSLHIRAKHWGTGMAGERYLTIRMNVFGEDNLSYTAALNSARLREYFICEVMRLEKRQCIALNRIGSRIYGQELGGNEACDVNITSKMSPINMVEAILKNLNMRGCDAPILTHDGCTLTDNKWDKFKPLLSPVTQEKDNRDAVNSDDNDTNDHRARLLSPNR